MEGLPETSKPILSLQLSSPVEEKELNEIYNPSSGGDDATVEPQHDDVNVQDRVSTTECLFQGHGGIHGFGASIACLTDPKDTIVQTCQQSP